MLHSIFVLETMEESEILPPVPSITAHMKHQLGRPGAGTHLHKKEFVINWLIEIPASNYTHNFQMQLSCVHLRPETEFIDPTPARHNQGCSQKQVGNHTAPKILPTKAQFS